MTDAKEYLRSKAEPVEFPGADFTTTAVPLYLAEEALDMLREQIAREIETRQGVLGLDRASVRTAARVARGEQR